MIEVYPHVALLQLLHKQYRIPYKIGKAARYGHGGTPAERRSQIFSEWRRILGALGKAISATPELRFEDSLPCRLKQYEDGIDALVCAWVGIKYLAGQTDPYGDDTAAIWIPREARAEESTKP